MKQSSCFKEKHFPFSFKEKHFPKISKILVCYLFKEISNSPPKHSLREEAILHPIPLTPCPHPRWLEHFLQLHWLLRGTSWQMLWASLLSQAIPSSQPTACPLAGSESAAGTLLGTLGRAENPCSGLQEDCSLQTVLTWDLDSALLA